MFPVVFEIAHKHTEAITLFKLGCSRFSTRHKQNEWEVKSNGLRCDTFNQDGWDVSNCMFAFMFMGITAPWIVAGHCLRTAEDYDFAVDVNIFKNVQRLDSKLGKMPGMHAGRVLRSQRPTRWLNECLQTIKNMIGFRS